jgi:hypothetical protein
MIRAGCPCPNAPRRSSKRVSKVVWGFKSTDPVTRADRAPKISTPLLFKSSGLSKPTSTFRFCLAPR